MFAANPFPLVSVTGLDTFDWSEEPSRRRSNCEMVPLGFVHPTVMETAVGEGVATTLVATPGMVNCCAAFDGGQLEKVQLPCGMGVLSAEM